MNVVASPQSFKHLKKMKNTSLKCVDLFAGAGGFSLAAIQAGIEVKMAVELNKHACETYRINILNNQNSSIALYNEDIHGLNPKELASIHFSDNEECDFLFGGPPCQGFSAHRINGAGIDDPRNKLIHKYFDFVEALQPRMFLMENVPGMLWPRHKDYLDAFYQAAAEAGYHVHAPAILDARDYGVPQRRKRVFILGLKKDFGQQLQWPPASTHGNENARLIDNHLQPWVDCQSVFEQAPVGDINDVHMNHGDDLIDAFVRTPPNGGSRRDSGRVLKCHENHDGHKDVYGRINPFEPAPTMTTACINPSKGRFVHPTEHHGITLRQAARIQTFPDNFVFHGGLIAAGQQIGNAVPIGLGRALTEHLAEYLNRLNSENTSITKNITEVAT